MLALLLTALAEPQLHTLDSLPNLGPGFGRHCVAYALNDAGDVGGAAQGAVQDTRPVIWRDGILTELGIIPGDLEGVVLGLNNSGSACGQSIGASDIHAVLWSGGSVMDLGNLGVPVASATALNDAGVVVGNAYPPAGNLTHAFLWDPATGAMTDLGTLGGDYSAAACVDAAGHAYGVAASAS